MRACFWPWLVLSVVDAVLFLLKVAGIFKDRSMLFHNKVKSCKELLIVF